MALSDPALDQKISSLPSPLKSVKLRSQPLVPSGEDCKNEPSAIFGPSMIQIALSDPSLDQKISSLPSLLKSAKLKSQPLVPSGEDCKNAPSAIFGPSMIQIAFSPVLLSTQKISVLPSPLKSAKLKSQPLVLSGDDCRNAPS